MVKSSPHSRFKNDIRIKPDVVVTPRERGCSIKGCTGEGTFKVPKSREHISTYLWVCLVHAKEHNEKWDYFKGMSDDDVVRFQEDALIGHRPTWPLGKRAAGVPGGDGIHRGPYHIEDGLAVFGDAAAPQAPRRPQRVLTRLQRQAFDILDLDSGATLNEIKARYKELVKRFHPDAHGGDRGTEERLKQVIKAYGILRASGLVS